MGHQLLEEDCLRVLEKFLNSKNFQLNTFEVMTFHNPLQGLVGEHFTLRMQYVHEEKTHTQDFFVKTLSTNPLLLQFSVSLMVYEKEAFLYDLLEKFGRYNIDTSFAPKGLFFKPYVTVLEDLSTTGYKGTPKITPLDLEHCQACVDTIAKFHAATIIYENRKSEELGRTYSLQEEYSDILEDKFDGKEETMATQYLFTTAKGLFHVIDLIPEDHVSHDDFKAKLSEFVTIERPDGLLTSVIHSDLWTSNFLYLYEDDKPVGCKLLDYQMIKYGPVELDLMQFLMTNTTKDFRDRNLYSMIDRYYKNLRVALSRAGFDGILPDHDSFVRSCEKFKVFGKVHAAVDHSITLVADEVYADALKTEDNFRRFLFEERGRYLEESYQKSKEYRERLNEDVLELRVLLFP